MKYDFEWTISDKDYEIVGTISIEAENRDEAKIKFGKLSTQDLVLAMIDGNDTVQVSEPTTEEEREAARQRRMASHRKMMETRLPWREPDAAPPELGGPISMKP
jgi:predicted dienelactone hydrolase